MLRPDLPKPPQKEKVKIPKKWLSTNSDLTKTAEENQIVFDIWDNRRIIFLEKLHLVGLVEFAQIPKPWAEAEKILFPSDVFCFQIGGR